LAICKYANIVSLNNSNNYRLVKDIIIVKLIFRSKTILNVPSKACCNISSPMSLYTIVWDAKFGSEG